MANRTSIIMMYLLLLSGGLLAVAIRGFAPMMMLAGFAALVALIARHYKPDWSQWPRYVLPLIFLAYAVASSFWSINADAPSVALRLVLTSLFVAAMIANFNYLDTTHDTELAEKWRRRLSISLLFGMAVTLLIAPYNVVWPQLALHLSGLLELVRQVNSALTLSIIFLFILCSKYAAQSPKLIGAGFIICLIITALSESQTALLALMLGLIALGLAWFSTRLCRQLIFAALAISILFAAPLFTASYQNKWVKNYAPTLVQSKGSGEIREWIFYVYAHEASKKPFFGHGLNSTKYFSPENIDSYFAAIENDASLRPLLNMVQTSRVVAAHAHNLFLQIIFEFGYVGALLLLAAVWQFFARLEALPKAQAIWIWGAIGAGLGAVMFSYTLWHSWLMAALGYSFFLAYIMLPAAPQQIDKP